MLEADSATRASDQALRSCTPCCTLAVALGIAQLLSAGFADMLAVLSSSGMCGEAESCKSGVGCKAGECMSSKLKHCGSREDSVLRACCECPACCTASDEAWDAVAELKEVWLCFRQESAGQVCCDGAVSSPVVEVSTMLQHWLVSACSRTDATVACGVLNLEVLAWWGPCISALPAEEAAVEGWFFCSMFWISANGVPWPRHDAEGLQIHMCVYASLCTHA